MNQQKVTLRQEMMKRRRQTDFDRLLFEDQIYKNIITSEIYIKSKIIALYYPVLGEVDLLPMAKQALQDRKQIAFPIIDRQNYGMRFALVRDLEADFKSGLYGIPEPKTTHFVEEPEIDLFLVPGLAFDADGNRLGMGTGCYDRYFEKSMVELRKRIGVAFGFQIVEQLPVEEGDRGVGGVVTEGGIQKISRE